MCWDLLGKVSQNGEWEVNIFNLYLRSESEVENLSKIHFLVILVEKTIFNGFSSFFFTIREKIFFFPSFLFFLKFFLVIKKKIVGDKLKDVWQIPLFLNNLFEWAGICLL